MLSRVTFSSRYSQVAAHYCPFSSRSCHIILHSLLLFLCPASTVANRETELRIENKAISVHILRALFSSRGALLSILLALVSHYSAFSSVLLTDANVLNCSKHSSVILNSPHSPVKFSSERSSFVLHSSLFAARYSPVRVNFRH